MGEAILSHHPNTELLYRYYNVKEVATISVGAQRMLASTAGNNHILFQCPSGYSIFCYWVDVISFSFVRYTDKNGYQVYSADTSYDDQNYSEGIRYQPSSTFDYALRTKHFGSSLSDVSVRVFAHLVLGTSELRFYTSSAVDDYKNKDYVTISGCVTVQIALI